MTITQQLVQKGIEKGISARRSHVTERSERTCEEAKRNRSGRSLLPSAQEEFSILCGKQVNFMDAQDYGKQVNFADGPDYGKQVNFAGGRDCGKQVNFADVRDCGKQVNSADG